jgi:hypothetical protein
MGKMRSRSNCMVTVPASALDNATTAGKFETESAIFNKYLCVSDTESSHCRRPCGSPRRERASFGEQVQCGNLGASNDWKLQWNASIVRNRSCHDALASANDIVVTMCSGCSIRSSSSVFAYLRTAAPSREEPLDALQHELVVVRPLQCRPDPT